MLYYFGYIVYKQFIIVSVQGYKFISTTVYHIFFKLILGQMAHNVPGCKRRFASPDKGLRSKTRAGKLWRSEAWERAQRPT
jgi:hypothetical protein